MAKTPMSIGKLPKRPTGKMGEPGGAAGMQRGQLFDKLPGQPKPKANTPGV